MLAKYAVLGIVPIVIPPFIVDVPIPTDSIPRQQGNDLGTQYRSAIYCVGEGQQQTAESSRARFQQALAAAGFGLITTEISEAPEFYFAEEYHQQYLAKHPSGYCGIGGTGVSCPIGILPS